MTMEPQSHKVCPGGWAIPPSPRMIEAGNDYHSCSICGLRVPAPDVKQGASNTATPPTNPEGTELDRCTRCNRMLPLSRFHKDKRLKNRTHRAACKDCVALNSISWYQKNKTAKNASNAIYRHANWEKMRQQAYNRRNPVKQRARQAINNALARNKIQRGICSVTGCEVAKTDFHHTDGYDKQNWFVGVWLCRRHHADLHYQQRVQELKSQQAGKETK